MPRTNVQMDAPTVVVMAHASSTTAERLSHRAPAGEYVSRTTVEVLRTTSSTDSAIRRRGAVARDDPERMATRLPSDALEDGNEATIDATERPVPVVSKLRAVEVLGEISHDYGRSRRRWVASNCWTVSDVTCELVPFQAVTSSSGASGTCGTTRCPS